MAYTTDLTETEFGIIQPLLPKPYIQTKPPKWTKHQILNGIFYQLINGCRWIDLPKDLPPTGTVFYWFDKCTCCKIQHKCTFYEGKNKLSSKFNGKKMELGK